MLNIDLRPILVNNLSRYSLVAATAKRARSIVDESKNNNEILVEKPVSIALDEFIKGKYKIIESEEIREF